MIRELANGRSVDYKGSTITLPWATQVAARGVGRRLRAEGAEDDRRDVRRLHPPARRPRHRRVDDQGRARAPPSRPAATPTTITICVAAPAYVGDDVDHMRDQCRWFGGMVGNHVADIVTRYGEHVRRAASADRLHQGPRGLRLQPARPGRQHARRVRARRDRRPLLHPRPGRASSSAGWPSCASSASTSSRSTSSTTPRTTRCWRTASTSSPSSTSTRWPSRKPRRTGTTALVTRRAVRRTLLFCVALFARRLPAGSSTRRSGPEKGGDLLGIPLAKTNDRAMPHTWDMVETARRAGEPRRRPRRSGARSSGTPGTRSSWPRSDSRSGAVFGIAAAVVMARFRFVERGLLPWIVMSQTVPLIALAPQVVSWSGKVDLFGWEWPRWLSVCTLAAFLAFFPISVGTLRGLSVGPAGRARADAELRRRLVADAVQAALPGRRAVDGPGLQARRHAVGGRRRSCRRSRPGVSGGIGRAVISYSQAATGDPTKVYAAVFGAAAMGLLLYGVDRRARRRR